MELEDEVKMLRRMREDVITAARDMKAALLDLYAPRQTPRPEVLTAVQLLASGEGFDAECPNHARRRAGLCQADDVEPECAPLWPEALWERLDDMAVGIALSAVCAEAGRAAIHAYITRMLESAAPGRKKRSKPTARPRG
ncbi:hypothetical protein [Allomesorhizobium camelthorni]|uniref:Uncharacterized protein n=1 Tax=Allomesorhizobium camelthorni TaxID=475069 RepID=A0A6G4WQ78_9HYPH|nr:hypothetical protein [Mesorhizobium camelthorni]NGO56270.1 hypothetical protein [Mesorhizobium camelthorni]